ncbi:hypothetical protein CTI12_AA116110 [Artemisia annua]|uniref:B box-type domain-containing protein n=1 Tax=Artemisia annua TaxID=35608 RepID=A0A2U1PT71_ARTAN|nr:hypothetical protein CTI12_AA116110 [Artemisia annua]
MKLLNKMKKCELCKSTVTIHCDSDRANLCWTCDATVHSANFLVAKHLRNLLCHVCQSPTPWTASGEKLSSSTVSVCGTCVGKGVVSNDDKEEKVGCNDGTSCTDGLVIDNKVVPPAASSSSSDEVSKGDKGVSMKRKRRNIVPDLNSEDEVDASVNINQTTSFNSVLSSSETTTRNTKRICHRDVCGSRKSTRAFDLDLNSLP